MPQYVGGTKVRPLTEGQAKTAFRAIVSTLERQLGYEPGQLYGPGSSYLTGDVVVHEQGVGRWPSTPVLVRNYGSWSTTSDWAVVWEGGDYDWAIYVVPGGRTPDGIDFGEGTKLAPVVFAEPIESFSLGLFRNVP